MNKSQSNLNRRRRATRFATMVMVFTALGSLAARAQAPSALFQNSTLTSTTNTINVTQLPVVTPSGTSYVNLVLVFDVSGDGTLTVAAGYPQQTPSTLPIDDGFLAGNYAQNSGNCCNLLVSGPGVAQNGVTVWSLSLLAGSGCVNPNVATWYDVGTAIKTSPIYSRLQKAGIKTTEYYQFGVGSGCSDANPWAADTLIGFSQTGKGLAISSFTNNGKDQSTPVTTTTYVFQP